MSRFSYQQVLNNLSSELENEIIDFWFTEGAMNDRVAASERLKEVLFIARDQENKIVAASSSYKQHNEQLQNTFSYMRAFVPERFNETDIAQQLLLHVRNLLESEYQHGKLENSKGLLLEISQEAIHKRYPEAIWPESEMVYIGKNPTGAHQRVYYFKDAKIN